MAQEVIKCPKCGTVIKLSEAISRNIEADIKKRYEKEMESRLEEERKRLQIKVKKETEESQRLEIFD